MDATRQSSMRKAAFDHVRRLQSVHDQLTAADLAKGFVFDGQRFPLVNPQRGIFKPKEMEHLLSIRTVFPKPGAGVWHDDRREVHGRSIRAGDYAFMGTSADVAENRWLREAWSRGCRSFTFSDSLPDAIKQSCLKAGATAAKYRARQLQAQADTSAERLDVQQSRQKLVQLQRKAETSTIKPYT